MVLGACGERAAAPACRQGKVKLFSRTRAPLCVDDCSDVQHGVSEGLDMQPAYLLCGLGAQ